MTTPADMPTPAAGVLGVVLTLIAVFQWRRRAEIVQRSNGWFSASSYWWRRVNEVRVRLGAVILGVLGLMFSFAAVVDAVRSLM